VDERTTHACRKRTVGPRAAGRTKKWEGRSLDIGALENRNNNKGRKGKGLKKGKTEIKGLKGSKR